MVRTGAGRRSAVHGLAGHATGAEPARATLRSAASALLLVALAGAVAPAAGLASAAGQEGIEPRSFDSDGVRLHYIDEGSGEPVLLIHGLALDVRLNWVRPGILAALTDHGYRVIAYDTRGHGDSEKLRDPSLYGPPEVEDPIRLLDHLGIDRAHVVGYSRGARIADHLRAGHPQRLRTVTLGGYAQAGGDGRRPDASTTAALTRSMAREDFRPLVRAVAPGASPEEVEAWNDLLRERNDGRAVAAAFRAGPSFPSFEEAELRANEVPTLAVIGERDGVRDGVERMRAVRKRLEVLVVPGADHASALERPELVTALLGFLARHREASP